MSHDYYIPVINCRPNVYRLKGAKTTVGRAIAQTAMAVADPVMRARAALSFHHVSSRSRIRVESVAPLSAARCKASLVDFITNPVNGAIIGRSNAVAVYSCPRSFVGAGM